jgi:hypothetical protein
MGIRGMGSTTRERHDWISWYALCMTNDIAYCECQCGEVIPPRKRPAKPQRFINGHQGRRNNLGVRLAGQRPYVPRPEEIPSGICECGCGGETAIAKHTTRATGRFAGYPARFIQGHNSPRHGDKHPNWRGGRIKDESGYVRVKVQDHPTANGAGYIPEHRLVMERHLGRYLLPLETVHHINGVRDDNRIENLELWSHSHPYGQRVDDKIEWAIEMLRTYRPEILSPSSK